MAMINHGFINIDKDTVINLERVDFIRNTNGHLDFHMSSGEVCSSTYSGIEDFFRTLEEIQRQAFYKAIESAKEESEKIISKTS